MSEPQLDRLEVKVRAAAAGFVYPPTPDVAGSVRRRLRRAAPMQRPDWATLRRRLAWVLVALVLAMGALISVPEVRARLVEFLQIGVVRIFLASPTPTPTPTGTPAASGPTPAGTLQAIATPRPTPTLLPSLLNLAGE